MGLAGWIIGLTLQAAPLPTLPAPPSLPCWIEGRWLSEEAEDRWTEENWTGCRAQTMLGTGRGGRADAVTSYEFMRIARNENGDLMFYGSPFGNPAAAFRAVKAGPAEVVFVNPNHSYPQRIRYWMEDGMLHAEASMIDGSKPQAWRYKRVSVQ